MKALTSLALVLLLCSCQKEIMFPPEPEAVIVKEEPPKEVIYRAEPNQQIVMSECTCQKGNGKESIWIRN